MHYFAFLALMLAVGWLALQFRSVADDSVSIDVFNEPEPGFNAIMESGHNRKWHRFLQAYVSALLLRLNRLTQSTRLKSQLTVSCIRQVMGTMFFGRGILHS